jgi:hypothetical protein
MAREMTTTIPLSPDTRDRLRKRGDMNDTYNDVVNRLLEAVDT